MARILVGVAVIAAGLGCASGAPETPPAPCPAAPECPAPTREVIVVPVPMEGAGETWCCAYEQDGGRRFALVDGPTACRTQYGSQGGAWTEGPECIPCCCRTPVSDTDASQGAVYELTSPVACAGVGECIPGGAEACAEVEPGKGVKGKAGKGKRKGG